MRNLLLGAAEDIFGELDTHIVPFEFNDCSYFALVGLHQAAHYGERSLIVGPIFRWSHSAARGGLIEASLEPHPHGELDGAAERAAHKEGLDDYC